MTRRRPARIDDALLDALPANVALVDATGHVVSVNEGWKRFGAANAMADAACGVGADYLGICEAAKGPGSAEAMAAARGLRSVLSGSRRTFTLEYPCHSSDEQRWYRMMVSPVGAATSRGALVVHVDISERVLAQNALQDSLGSYRRIVSVLPDLILTVSDGCVTFVNEAGVRLLRAGEASRVVGRSASEFFAPTGPAGLRQRLSCPVVPVDDPGFAEDLLLTLDGRTVEVDAVATTYLANGRPLVQVVCRDLTEHKLQAARFTEEHRRLLQAQAVARVGSWEVDLRSWALSWSAECHRIFDTDARTFEPSYARFLQLSHPEDRAAVDAGFRASFGSTAPCTTEHRLLLDGGRVKTVEERWQVFHDVDGTALRALGTCRDITEKKQAEQLLRRSEAMVHLAGHMARLGGWSVDVPSMTLHWSDVVAALHDKPAGYAPSLEEALAFYADEHRAIIATHFSRCVEEGTPFDLELQIVSATGQLRWVRALGQPERDEVGRIVRVGGAFQEITARKEAEQATRELADRLQNTLERLTDGFITVDSEWRITYVNRQAEHLTARGRASLLGRSVWDEFPQLLGSAAQQHYEQAVREQMPVAFELDYAPLQKWFDVDAYPSAHGLAISFRDVSGRKRDQDALRELNSQLEARVEARTAELSRARAEAEQASLAKSAFLAAMSHEIRTPMNGVIGMIDVLQQSSPKGDHVEMVDLIRDSAYSLLGIIDDILDFSKIEAGRMELDRAALRLADMLESVCSMLDHTAIKRGVRVAMFADPDIPPWLVGDEARLRQVLVNLLGNAIKFCSGPGRLGRVAVRARLLASDADTATVEMSVTDNGIGLDEATAARLFKPFEQGDASTTRQFGGTGLGLAISGTLVQLMGGQITVHSRVGHGATFSVSLTLPRAEGDAPAYPEASLIAGMHCCIVGNDLPLADDLAAYLSGAGVSHVRVGEPSAATNAPLWILLPSQTSTDIEALRSMAQRAGSAGTRFFKLGSGYRRRPRLQPPDLMMLDHCGLTRRLLYRMLALASGRLDVREVEVDQDASRRPTAPEGHARAERSGSTQILVAEDNETNRQVIQHQLRLAGFDAEYAEDGHEALALWRGGDFDLLFTDVHMPRMDGYALAAAIRQEEKIRGGRRTAIVALTANALRTEEQRCRAAGMDAYLSKPVRLDRLKAALDEWLPSTPPVDLTALRALIGDDESAIRGILQAFCLSATDTGAALLDAFAQGDLAGVAEAAHKLKSSARSVGAGRLAQRCEDLEMRGETSPRELVGRWVRLFEADLQAVVRCLEGGPGPFAPRGAPPASPPPCP